MGTRSISAYKHGGFVRAQYSQFDGYLSEKGVDFLDFLAKALPYLAFMEKKHPADYDRRLREVMDGRLSYESLLTGHGWRCPDEDGNDWAYQEGTDSAAVIEGLACGIEYIRMADFDAGEIRFYQATLDDLIFSVRMEDLRALGWHTREAMAALKVAFRTYEEEDWDTRTLTVDFETVVPPEDAPEFSTDHDDCVVIKVNGEVVFATSGAPAADRRAYASRQKLLAAKEKAKKKARTSARMAMV